MATSKLCVRPQLAPQEACRAVEWSLTKVCKSLNQKWQSCVQGGLYLIQQCNLAEAKGDPDRKETISAF